MYFDKLIVYHTECYLSNVVYIMCVFIHLCRSLLMFSGKTGHNRNIYEQTVYEDSMYCRGLSVDVQCKCQRVLVRRTVHFQSIKSDDFVLGIDLRIQSFSTYPCIHNSFGLEWSLECA